ncbi:MAG: AAA family ATPase [Thaumarchaeota archaeon]|nr:AAA family ATPase [Nitrososphaerota archaeon]
MAEEERRLAAIMFTDLVGYTALTQESESTALALLQEHASLLRPVFAKHGGREVKMIGDSFLVEFSSALSATLCAVEIQRVAYERNVSNPSSKIQLRIGIHVGDVIYRGADVFGDAVNIASRIEPLSTPGSVCISQQVYDQVWNKIDHPLVGLGKHDLKNVQVPMEVYRVVLPWEKEAIAGEAKKIIPLVDRVAELARLRSALETMIQSEGNLFFVAGEAGIGKTRIAEELSATARERRITTLYGRCSRREGKIPYAPWVEQIREFVRTSPPQLLFKVIGNHAAEVAKLVPEITASVGPVNAGSSGSVDQDRLSFIDGISQLVVNISKEGPLLIIFDDMNWADAGSLDLILSAARQAQTHRILVLGIYRDVEVEEDSDLFEFLYEVKREKLGETLTLKGFGPEDTGLMIGEILGQKTVDVEFRDLVYAKTGGNPFFIEELVRSMVEQGVLFRTANGWDRKPISEIEIPSGVRTVIKQRLSNLDEECMGILSVASVTSSESKEFSFALLKAVTGMDENRLVDAMDRVLRTRLIRETKMASGRPGFAFTDTRIRDAIYEEMTLLRRGRYHVKAAQAVEVIYKDRLEDVYGVLVYHYMKGNDQAKALEYALKAADRASKVYAHGEAANYLRIALEALEDTPDKAARSRVLEKLGEADRYSGRQDFAKRLEEAARLAAEVNENQRAAKIYRNLAFWSFDLNRENVTAPNGYFEKAKAALAKEGETEETAQLYHTLARFYFLTGRLPESKDLATKALALSAKLGLPEVEAHAHLTLAIVAPATEKEAKFQNMKKALAIGLEHNFYDVVMRAYNNLTVESESVEEGLKYSNEALSYFDRVGYKSYVDFSKLLVAGASMFNGDLERARAIAQEFISDPSASPSSKREAIAEMGEVLTYQGRYDEAEEYLHRFHGILEGGQDFQELLRAGNDFGVLYVEMGDYTKARKHLEEYMNMVREKNLSTALTYAQFIVGTLWYLVQASIGVGDMDAARAASKEAGDVYEKARTDLVLGGVLAIDGAMKAAEKKFPEAVAAYEKAVGMLGKGIAVFFEARLFYELGTSCAKNGDWEKARSAFGEAKAMFTRMGNKVYLERVQSAIAALPAAAST